MSDRAAPPDVVRDWLRLLLVPGVGRQTARALVDHFGSPKVAIQADAETLRAQVGTKLAAALVQVPAELDAALDRVARWLDGGSDRHVLAWGDPRYPARLAESPDPPLLLFVQGQLAVLQQAAIAVVGSRHPTAQGRDHAQRFAQALGDGGLVVVSGLAMGVDGAAHEGALASASPTVAVVGTGLDRVYPPRHHGLAQRIAERGALVSEYLPGTPALPEHFPQRNRIIAGMSLGTLVVEAALQSGSLITARLANEAGREVFAIPGSIQSLQSRGCHALIREGAQLVESPQEVLDALAQPALFAARHVEARPEASAPAQADPRHGPLLAALGHDPLTLDELQSRSGEPVDRLLALLMELELAGAVAALPGGLYQRRGLA